MKTKVTEELRVQAQIFSFRFSCRECAYFDEEIERCSEGYPVDEHLDGSLRSDEVLFCKLFESG